MVDIRIILSSLWISLFLVYLFGDVLRIFSGDFQHESYTKISKAMYYGIAIFMVIPIFMIPFSLTLPYEINRAANIIVAALFFIFNVFGLPSYLSAYDRFLIVVGLIFNFMTIWYAWNWV